MQSAETCSYALGLGLTLFVLVIVWGVACSMAAGADYLTRANREIDGE